MTETDELADALAVVLYQEVRAAGWNLEQLGRELGLSEQTMQRYLTRRERDLPARVLVGAARAIGVPLTDLIEAAERRAARGENPHETAVQRQIREARDAREANLREQRRRDTPKDDGDVTQAL